MKTKKAIAEMLSYLDKETASKLWILIEKKEFVDRLDTAITMIIGFVLGAFFVAYVYVFR